jgi:hypothetical protein
MGIPEDLFKGARKKYLRERVQRQFVKHIGMLETPRVTALHEISRDRFSTGSQVRKKFRTPRATICRSILLSSEMK